MAKEPSMMEKEMKRRDLARINSQVDLQNVVVHPTKIAMVQKERDKRAMDMEKVKQKRISDMNMSKPPKP